MNFELIAHIICMFLTLGYDLYRYLDCSYGSYFGSNVPAAHGQS